MASEFQIPGLRTIPLTDGQPTEPSRSTSDDIGPMPMKLDHPQGVLPLDNVDVTSPQAPDSPPSLISGLEALLGELEPSSAEINAQLDHSQENEVSPDQQGKDIGKDQPEWEEDSSPYESSSDSSSSDDSDDDESEDGENYQVLGPEETARILMEMEGESDGEGGQRSKGSAEGGQLRSKNELPEEILPKPDFKITPDMPIEELGKVEHIIGNTIVIQANTTGEQQVLDTGSALCLEDRTVIATLADLIGSVRQPRYTAGFKSADEIKSLGLELGTKIFYPPSHASYVFTQTLRTEKGTDASNLHDEEAGVDEIEFSDDEKEAEYKKRLKAKRKGGHGGREATGGRGGRGDSQNFSPPTTLKYDDDDNDDDGPYRPLTRPSGFGSSQQPGLTPINNDNGPTHSRGGSFRGSRGHRGRGNRRAGSRGGHSLPPRPSDYQQTPPQPNNYNYQHLPPPLPLPPPPSQLSHQAFPPQYPQFSAPPHSQQPPNVPFQFPWPQNAPPGFVPPPPPQFSGQQSGVGAYFNPAFLAGLQNQMNGHGNHNNNQWPGHGGQR